MSDYTGEDINNYTSYSNKEILNKIEELQKIIDDRKKLAEDKNYRKIHSKINSITDDEIKTILKFTKHDRTSCFDDDPCNGFYYDKNDKETYRCRKCALMEILKEKSGFFDFYLQPVLIPYNDLTDSQIEELSKEP